MQAQVKSLLQASISVKEQILSDDVLVSEIEAVTNKIISVFQSGNKVLLCGNGGSASDAQHIAAEFSGRFYKDRKPLPSEALHCNTSYLTAVANDYGYDYVYSRLLEGLGKKGDLIIGLSTSGNSKNVVKAFEKAKELGITTVSMTGNIKGGMISLADFALQVPSSDTPRIQECHITIGHIICQIVEEKLFTEN